MGSKKLRIFCVIFTAVLVVDWLLGVLYVHNITPEWLFLLTNVPFGFLHMLVEKAWIGGQYVLLGLTLREEQINLIYLIMVTAQSGFYFKVFEWVRGRRIRSDSSFYLNPPST